MKFARSMLMLIFLFSLFISPVMTFAEVNLDATGNDWVKYNSSDKEALVYITYEKSGIDPQKHSIRDGVKALDNYFSNIVKLAKERQIPEEALLKVRCSDTLRALIRVMGE